MRFIHTADWQIGKFFKQFGGKEEILRRARLDAVDAIGRFAAEKTIPHVLVAGDVYDSDTPTEVTLREPLERMKTYPHVRWHLLPGNHDPHRPAGVWDRAKAANLPANVVLCLEATPTEIEPGVALLPCPLKRKSEVCDLTAWMDEAATPPDNIRIGLAHGTVTGFKPDGEASNPIDPTRARSARLDYLALGDWHRTVQIGPATWYAGTPEPDRAGSQNCGTILLVDIPHAGATISVTPVELGTYRWLAWEESLTDGSELVDIEARIRALPNLSRTILGLRLFGSLPLQAQSELADRQTSLEAAVFQLFVDKGELVTRPTTTDLEAIDFDGVLRGAADRLLAQAADSALDADERQRANEALVQLYLLITQPLTDRA